ncbi:hypothetical protein D3C80_1920280 [compost metagenome]
MQRHLAFLVGRADLRIGADHPRDHVDAGQVGGGLGSVGVGPGGFDAALELAEQVELIGQAGVEVGEVDHWHLLHQQELLAGHLDALRVGTQGLLEAAPVLRLVHLGGGAAEVG